MKSSIQKEVLPRLLEYKQQLPWNYLDKFLSCGNTSNKKLTFKKSTNFNITVVCTEADSLFPEIRPILGSFRIFVARFFWHTRDVFLFMWKRIFATPTFALAAFPWLSWNRIENSKLEPNLYQTLTGSQIWNHWQAFSLVKFTRQF